MEEPKDPTNDAVYKIYSYLATAKEREALAAKYRKGGFGYGEAKKMLLEKILEHFGAARKKRIELQKDVSYVDSVLKKGAEKAKKVASQTMSEVKVKTGLQL